MKQIGRWALAAVLVACGGSDDGGGGGGPTDTNQPPPISGVPDGTFTVTLDDPTSVRTIQQGKSFDLKLHVQRGVGIGTVTLTAENLPKVARAGSF